jgi:alpha-galactosidase
MDVPESAKDPLYSTWYAFTQNVTASKIEEEAALAARLGMKTLILDDGWQTDETGRAYERCGDMAVSSIKFPDGMAAHVKRVQACGIKYMIWCAVPFVGYKNAVHGRFKGKYLREQASVHCSVLDPRFPEVREYLAGMFERMLEEWGVDGFKFDYVGQLALAGDEKDPALADGYKGRDTKSVPDAVDMLMTDIITRLRKIKKEVLIEYRQPYLGPAIRRYGNIIRAIDCPGEMQKNIVRTAMLRLTSGRTAVHSDMLEWNLGDTPESAAQSILASLFSTVQYSMALSRLSESHLRMLKHWIGFTQRHRKTLLDGDFIARYPQAHFPVLEAASGGERVIAVYLSGQVAGVRAEERTVVVNATGTKHLHLELPCGTKAKVFDTFGMEKDNIVLGRGIRKIEVPVSGYVELLAE